MVILSEAKNLINVINHFTNETLRGVYPELDAGLRVTKKDTKKIIKSINHERTNNIFKTYKQGFKK